MIKVTGNWNRTSRFLKRAIEFNASRLLHRYGNIGVNALAAATPKNTGLTSMSWKYKIEFTDGAYAIVWYNTNINRGVSIAMLIQYGHGTGNGGYISSYDYINPAMRPIFDSMAQQLWLEVKNL